MAQIKLWSDTLTLLLLLLLETNELVVVESWLARLDKLNDGQFIMREASDKFALSRHTDLAS